ncbi:CPBP family intramembrane metalloprotease [Microbacterium pseudoresistens]|uniref:Membrane protease YdiL (CAAX protease family) n=1 Tax=Microbacterium pseudoresistens TaxID=640634 RepID=A0A7Y9JM37_9MICO|nr:type II CAAX endopeptidase family protein [Microbacterium pseudoresistens]NYD53108.1 membrane protease YdiL (CAAX protease family) [Microbacterium pseudoresistens]
MPEHENTPENENMPNERAVAAAPPVRISPAATIVFVVLACALAWLVALPLWLDSGLGNPLATVLVPLMMFTPLIAALIVVLALRAVPKGQRLRFLGMWPLRPARRVVWLMVLGWLSPIVIVMAALALAAAAGWVALDFSFASYAALLSSASGVDIDAQSAMIAAVVQLAVIPFAALFNAVFAFGEELGWRGFLVPALRPLGTWPALILSGAIWGLWHAPVILLGYNFGRTDLTGVVFMTGGSIAWGVLLGWLRLRSASVWPAVLAHGTLNAAGGLVLILAASTPDMALAGPLGVSGWIVCALAAVILLLTGQFRRQPALAA